MVRGPSTASRVATRWEERFAQRMAGERLLEEDAPQIGMAVELDAEHVVRLALGPVRTLPHAGERRHVRVELGARRAQHHEDLRLRTAHERHAAQLGAGVYAGVH